MVDKSLPQVIFVDEQKCINCHACITACPVKYCNDGSGTTVTVNADMCIACGSCITACTHDARKFIDDFDIFINDIIAGDKIVAISAPAAAASFPEMYLQLNTWLKQLGVEAVFDVSFGAELTTKSYVNYIQENNPQTVIAQPCAAIVSYIELYQPELIKHLAPADSPMLHTIKMIQKYYPQYKNHKVAIISPCNAKKREFEETGLGNYNIAHKSIQDFLNNNNIDLSQLEKTDFDNPQAERAVLFSSPGGLLETAKRWIPGIGEKTRKIEGVHVIYDYLKTLPKMIEEGKSPLLIDCLNCEFGCNAGPLTNTKDKPVDEIEYYVKKRSKELKEKYLIENKNNEELTKKSIEETLDKYWEKGLYNRTYVNRWENVNLKYPNEKELEEIYASMHKFTNEDIKNCSACGYGTCNGMAIAIFNKLNKPENCHFYLQTENTKSLEKSRISEAKLKNILDTSVDGFVEVNNDEIILDANPAFKKILKKSDIIGRSLLDFIPDSDIEIIKKEMKVRKKGIFKSYELKFKQSDEKTVSCLISASPVYSKGEKVGSFAMISDISQLKEKEQQLKDFSDNLEKTVEQRTAELNNANVELEKLSIVASETDNAIIIMDGKGNFEWANNAYENRYGRNLNELIKQKGSNIQTANKNVPEFKKAYKILLKDKTSVAFKKKELDKDNNKIFSQITLSPILNSENEIDKIVLIKTDISELMQKENELIEQAVEMEELLEELHTTNEVIETKNKELEKLSIVASQTDNAIVIMDNLGNFEWINNAFYNKYGLNLEELKNKLGKDIITATKSIDLTPIIHKTIYEKTSVEYETTEIDKNGNKIFTQTTLTPILDDQGNVKNIVAVNSDISKLKDKENELIKQSAEMSELVEELNATNEIIQDINEELEQLSIVASETDNAIVIMDGKGNFEWVNEAFSETYGMFIEELIEKRGSNIVEANNNSELIKDKLNTVITEKKSATYQQQEINAKDNTIFTQTTLTPILNTDGTIKKIVAINTDITELKEAEEHIKQKNEEVLQQQEELLAQRDALADSEAQIKYILSSLPDAAVVIDKKGSVTFWNKAIENMTGVKAEDMLGKNNYEYAIPFYGERKPILINLVNESKEYLSRYSGIRIKDGILQAETFVPSLKGKKSYLVGTASILYDSDGEYSGAIEIIHDITTRRHERDELAKQKKHVTDSIVYASRIQQALLPPNNMAKKYLNDYFIFYRPRDIVSGDFYWIGHRNHKIIIVAADCTGHGVPGAFMSMLGISFLNEIVNKDKITQPDIILNKMRANIKKSLRQKGKRSDSQDGMDMAICTYEPGTDEIEFAGAYNPLLLVRNKELHVYKADKMPVAISLRDANPFTLNKIKIEKNDSLYIFSDGFVDQIGEKTKRKYLTKNFKKLLIEISDKPMNEQERIIDKEFESWKGNLDQIDDVLVWGFKI